MLTTAHRLLGALLPLLFVLGACNRESDSQKELQKRIEEQKVTDEATIQKYLADRSITDFERTTSGLYIVRKNTVTSGPQPQLGKAVEVKYNGYRLTDGTRFDSSIENNNTGTATLTLGPGSVIDGWNEGLTKLYKGHRVLLLIPSHLAYGANGRRPSIAPFTPLLFEIEIINIIE